MTHSTKLFRLFTVLLLSLTLAFTLEAAPRVSVERDGTYTSKEYVAAYIHQFGRLPSNYITKAEARRLGWVSSQGNLNRVAPGKSIGGDRFGNYEQLLPEKKGRQYYECDIDYRGGRRNAKRIIFSSDGLIYYTEDHYNTFELLYGKEKL
ncbi:MAG: hypothetical protein IJR85_04375 [Synergistaceae bacterium]|nr:hypothetical protein [Synergistaceae bacterium]